MSPWVRPALDELLVVPVAVVIFGFYIALPEGTNGVLCQLFEEVAEA